MARAEHNESALLRTADIRADFAERLRRDTSGLAQRSFSRSSRRAWTSSACRMGEAERCYAVQSHETDPNDAQTISLILAITSPRVSTKTRLVTPGLSGSTTAV